MVELLAPITQQLSSLNATTGTMASTMSQMQQQLADVSARTVANSEAVTALAKAQKAQEDINKETSHKFEVMQQAMAEIKANVERTPKQVRVDAPATTGSSTDAGPQVAPGRARAQGSGDQDIFGFENTVVWIKGFPHKVMADIMKTHADGLLRTLLAENERGAVEFKGRNFQRNYALIFPNREQARNFKQLADDSKIEWVNTRTKETIQLKAQYDKSLGARITDNVLQYVYPPIEKALKDNDKWKDIKKMGNTGLPRVFFVQTNDGEGYPFYTIKVGQDKKATMDIDYDNLMHFGIPKATADKIAADAVASASSSRGR